MPYHPYFTFTNNPQAAPTPPPAPVVPDRNSGGYFEAPRKRRTAEAVSEARQRLGLVDELAAAAIAEVAARQAQAALEAESSAIDAHKRFEELERELALRDIAWRSEYLEALEKERSRLIGLRDEQAVVAMLLLAAGAAVDI